MKPLCLYRIMYAAWPGAGRKELCDRLVQALPAERTKVIESPEKLGSWWTARRCWEDGIVWAGDATHVCVLNDDVEPIPFFDKHLHNALAVFPNEPIALYTKHKRCPSVDDASWYVSANGMSVGIVLPMQLVRDFLWWVDTRFVPPKGKKPYPSDALVDLFLMDKGRPVYTTIPALVEHMAPDSSLLGNDHHPARKAIVTGPVGDWTRLPVHLPPVYLGTHWHLSTHVNPPNFTRAYEIERALRGG